MKEQLPLLLLDLHLQLQRTPLVVQVGRLILVSSVKSQFLKEAQVTQVDQMEQAVLWDQVIPVVVLRQVVLVQVDQVVLEAIALVRRVEQTLEMVLQDHLAPTHLLQMDRILEIFLEMVPEAVLVFPGRDQEVV